MAAAGTSLQPGLAWCLPLPRFVETLLLGNIILLERGGHAHIEAKESAADRAELSDQAWRHEARIVEALAHERPASIDGDGVPGRIGAVQATTVPGACVEQDGLPRLGHHAHRAAIELGVV